MSASPVQSGESAAVLEAQTSPRAAASEPAHVPEVPPAPGLGRIGLAEFVGTAGLVCAVIGSGIAAQRLSPTDVGLQLLENAFATTLALVAILLALGSISGAHVNPAVSVVEWARGALPGRDAMAYVGAQVAGGFTGAIVANAMFGLPAFHASTQVRAGAPLLVGEVVATLGLLLTIHGTSRSHARAVPFAVGCYIGAAYWFTSSTSFANPAVTLARAVSDTFAGIAPASVPGFVAAQMIGAAAGGLLLILLLPDWNRRRQRPERRAP